MTSPNRKENLISLRSPEVENQCSLALANPSPGSNPFDLLSDRATEVVGSDSLFKVPFSPRNDVRSPLNKKRSPLSLLDTNNSFDMGRESLGILPSIALQSVASDLFETNLPDTFEIGNLSVGFLNISGRESLGILNTSVINDLGRESIGIFNVKNSFRRRSSDDSKENYPAQSEISVLSLRDQSNNKSTGPLNTGFLLDHSRKLSACSQNISLISTNPSFHSQSLEEPSEILRMSNWFQKTQDFGASSMNIFNEALQGSEAFLEKQFTASSFTTPSTKGLFSSNLGFVRHRIHSLPVTWEEKSGINIDTNCYVNLNIQNEYNDFVFEEAKKLVDNIAEDVDPNDSKNLSSNNENNFLDATPQPEWPDDLSESKLNESVFEEKAAFDKETIAKQVDNLFEKLPNVTEKTRIRIQKNSGSTSSENSTNISRISKTSRGTNKSQNISQITRNSEECMSALLSDLSNFIHDNGDLSNSMKEEGKNALNVIQNILHVTRRSNRSRNSNNNDADSGHSSVDDQQLEEQKISEKSENFENKVTDSPSPNPNFITKSEHTLSKFCTSKVVSKSRDSPTTSKIAILKTPNSSTTSNNSQNSNEKKNNNTHSVRYSLATGSQRMFGDHFSGTKSGPLKAVIPVENMAKKLPVSVETSKVRASNSTPPMRQSHVLRSEKTSTPIHEPKLKPMAASTPTEGVKKSAAGSPVAKLKYSAQKSVANKPKYATTLVRRNSLTDQKTTKKTSISNVKNSLTSGEKSAPVIVRRNSVADAQSAGKAVNNKPLEKMGTRLAETDSGIIRSSRRFSTGSKDTKIMSALSKVRQNILNSPYYSGNTSKQISSQEQLNPGTNTTGDSKRPSGTSSMINSSKKFGKKSVNI